MLPLTWFQTPLRQFCLLYRLISWLVWDVNQIWNSVPVTGENSSSKAIYPANLACFLLLSFFYFVLFLRDCSSRIQTSILKGIDEELAFRSPFNSTTPWFSESQNQLISGFLSKKAENDDLLRTTGSGPAGGVGSGDCACWELGPSGKPPLLSYYSQE